MMIATLLIPQERCSEKTGRMERGRLWDITDRTARTWLNEAVEAAASEGGSLVTLHTLRHSYAMHMLCAGTPLKALQSLLGHKKAKSTEIYTRVFALDVTARNRVQFQMSGTEAVVMLKK